MIFEVCGHVGRDFSLIGDFGKADFADGEARAVGRTLRVPQVAEMLPDAGPHPVLGRIKLGQLGGSSDGERVHFPLTQSSETTLASSRALRLVRESAG